MKDFGCFLQRAGLFLLVTFIFSYCGKMPINGKLDGRWQLMVINYHADGEQEKPEYTYYDFALHLMQFRQTRATDGGYGYINGRFNHVGDSLHVRMIRQNKNVAKRFGLNDTIQHFSVEKLTNKRMVLNSDYARLEFRKF